MDIFAPYKLLFVHEDPLDGYRLMTVEEVLARSLEVTNFLAFVENGIEPPRGGDDYRSLSMVDVLENDAKEIQEVKGEQRLQSTDAKTTINFLVYQKVGKTRLGGVLKIQICKEDKINKEIPNLSALTSEMLLEKALMQKRPLMFLVNMDHGFESNEVLKLDFEEIIIGNVESEDEEQVKTYREIKIDINREIPEGYRLATLEELLTCAKHNIKFQGKKTYLCIEDNESQETQGMWLVIRCSNVLKSGKERDIQDFGGSYFAYNQYPSYEHSKIRLKNGFIDTERRLVWKEFTKHFIEKKLLVCSKYIDHEQKTLMKDDKVIALLFACFLDSNDEVEELLEDPQYFEIMSTNNMNAPAKGSALHLCAFEGMLDFLKIFWRKLEKEDEKDNACLMKADRDGETPLHMAMAITQQKNRVVKMLCRSKTINEATRREKSTALMIATQYQMDNPKIWMPILECEGLKLDIKNRRKNNIYHMISYYEGIVDDHTQFTLLKNLLELCGCKVSPKAYQAAGKVLNKDVIKEVATYYRYNNKHTQITSNVSNVINQTNDRLSTPLHKSLGLRDKPTSSAADDDNDGDDDEGHAPPPCVVIPIQISRLLISAGADIQFTDTQGQNILHRACLIPDDQCTIEILLHCFLGDNLDDMSSKSNKDAKRKWSQYICSQDFYGQTPLHLAARSGNKRAISLFLDPNYNNMVGTLLEMRDFNDKTILHFVATPPGRFFVEESVKVEIAKLICNATADSMLPLLTWSVAEGLLLADELAKVSKYEKLAEFLKLKRESFTENLLGLALSLDKNDMVVELINRGAIITKQMRDSAKIEHLLKKEARYLDQKIHEDVSFDDDDKICAKLKKNCLNGLYKSRKLQVEHKMNTWKKLHNQPNLVQIQDFDRIKTNHRGRTTDQPTFEDLLDRGDIKSSISALLLNQHMGSPITLGIFGGTGMGKSSMMLQVEHHLLSKAASETLLLARISRKPKVANSFTGAKQESIESKRHARQLLHELQDVIRKNERKKNVDDFDEEAINLKKIKEKERMKKNKKWTWYLVLEHILKTFVNDRISLILSMFKHKDLSNETIEEKINTYITKFNEENMWILKRLALANRGREVPALMTVRYNAWQYETRDEAWAGLAVEILKEMESCMTRGQLLYASIMYTYYKSPSKVMVNLVIPIIVYVVLGVMVGWIAYKLLAEYLESLKYGSIPISILITVWKVLTEVSNYAKPISETFIEATKSLQVQHLSKVGYQHQVIEDINFLRDKMCVDISLRFLWRIGALFLNITSGSKFSTNRMETSDVLKHIPPKENFRITVFIDNLDRQKEKLYTPLNMILKSCDINAVVAIDRESVEGVIDKQNDENKEESQKQGDKQPLEMEIYSSQKDTLLQQLIQIPIVLPEPDVSELINSFLRIHLKDMKNKKKEESETIKANSLISHSNSNQNEDLVHQESSTPPSIQILNGDDIETNIDKAIGHQNKNNYPIMEAPPSIHILDGDDIECDNDKTIGHQDTNNYVTMGGQRDDDIESANDKAIDNQNTNKYGSQSDYESSSDWLEVNVNVLDSNYSRGEIEIFKYLAKHTYGYYRSPRAWKSLLNYHRLIRSLMTYNHQYAQIKAWKRQLIVWVFGCWQWREQMNDIFKNWEKLTRISIEEIKGDTILVDVHLKAKLLSILRSDLQLTQLKGKKFVEVWDSIDVVYSSLAKIVEKQMNSISSSSSSSLAASSLQNQKEKEEENQKAKEVVEEEEADKRKKKAKVDWDRLNQALVLGKYDVTMHAMQAFQKYRFDCDASPLTLAFTA